MGPKWAPKIFNFQFIQLTTLNFENPHYCGFSIHVLPPKEGIDLDNSIKKGPRRSLSLFIFFRQPKFLAEQKLTLTNITGIAFAIPGLCSFDFTGAPVLLSTRKK
jgi:hypothetical protein